MLGLIEEALEAAERQAEAGRPEPEKQPHGEAGVGPCEGGPEDGNPQPQEEGDPTVSGAEQAV